MGIIMKTVLDSKVYEAFEDFSVMTNFRVTQMKNVKHDFKMAVLDRKTNSFGFVVSCDKRMVKESSCRVMEEMRFLARARNCDELFGISTTLYEWQFLHYSRKGELAEEKDFYTMSSSYPLYYKSN